MSRTRNFIYLSIGSAFGLGLSPIAPGSFGALLGVAFHVAVAVFLPTFELIALAAGLAVVGFANYWLTPWAVEYWRDEDPRHFVLDEIAGYLVVPLVYRGGELLEVATLGFLLFRTFDVIKILPARQLDRSLHGHWGILLDDLVSGTYAGLALHALAWLGIVGA